MSPLCDIGGYHHNHAAARSALPTPPRTSPAAHVPTWCNNTCAAVSLDGLYVRLLQEKIYSSRRIFRIINFPAHYLSLFKRDLDNPRTIAFALGSFIKFLYVETHQILFLSGMPCDFHNIIIPFLGLIYAHLLYKKVLKTREFGLLQLNSGNSHPLRTSKQVQITTSDGKIRKKSIVNEKQPDACLTPMHPSGNAFSMYPSVFCESGFTQAYSDLRLDMQQWFAASGGRAQVGFLLKTFEDRSILKKRPGCTLDIIEHEEDPSDFGSQSPTQIDMNIFDAVQREHDWEISPDHGMTPTETHKTPESGTPDPELYDLQASSEAATYEELIETINVSDWIGRLEVIFEVWRWDSITQQAFIDGPRVLLVHDPNHRQYLQSETEIPLEELQPGVLMLKARDVLPGHVSDDDKRELDLISHLKTLKETQNMAVKKVAAQRKILFDRKQKRTSREDPIFHDPGEPEYSSSDHDHEDNDDDDDAYCHNEDTRRTYKRVRVVAKESDASEVR